MRFAGSEHQINYYTDKDPWIQDLDLLCPDPGSALMCRSALVSFTETEFSDRIKKDDTC